MGRAGALAATRGHAARDGIDIANPSIDVAGNFLPVSLSLDEVTAAGELHEIGPAVLVGVGVRVSFAQTRRDEPIHLRGDEQQWFVRCRGIDPRLFAQAIAQDRLRARRHIPIPGRIRVEPVHGVAIDLMDVSRSGQTGVRSVVAASMACIAAGSAS